MKYIIMFPFLTLVYFTISAPMSTDKGMNYLENFGYTKNKSKSEMSEKEKTEAIQEFQKYFNISMTGVIDNDTLKMMQIPRCKKPDIQEFEYTGRWNHSHVTFKFLNFPINNYNETTATKLITKAMALWIDQIDLVIERIDDARDPNINIEFVQTSDFNDPSGVVIAYAEPPANGDMYYLDENWEEISDGHLDLFQIAAHEFGHSIGLNHYNDKNSVMYPMFEYKKNFKLQPVDLLYAQTLYGKKYSLCQDGNIDAALVSHSTKYMFRRTQCWKFKSNVLEHGYPKLLHEEWAGLTSSINAAFQYNNHIYFIQSKDVFKHNGSHVQKFETLDDVYDAAVTIDDRLYTFKGSQYWRYDINEKGMSMVRVDYPRNISKLWKGVPGDIDAAYYDGNAYFFKGKQFYKFNTNAIELKDAVVKSISEWDGCLK